MTEPLELVPRLRRMVKESTTSVYSDAELVSYIRLYPIPDYNRKLPDQTGWIPTYDLNAAASDIWLEKAASSSEKFDFQADGGNYSENQVYENCMKMHRMYGARRRAQNRTVYEEASSV